MPPNDTVRTYFQEFKRGEASKLSCYLRLNYDDERKFKKVDYEGETIYFEDVCHEDITKIRKIKHESIPEGPAPEVEFINPTDLPDEDGIYSKHSWWD